MCRLKRQIPLKATLMSLPTGIILFLIAGVSTMAFALRIMDVPIAKAKQG